MTEYRKVYDEVRSVSGGKAVLVSVSKFHPYEAVLEAYAEGARIFGENRVQEIEAKFPLPENRPEGMEVYLIGQLQRNKVRKVVPLVSRIESVDSMPLIEKIEQEASRIDKRIDVLLEYNSSGEEQKSGFLSADELCDAALFIIRSCPHIRLRGVMTIGPLGYDREKNMAAFNATRDVFQRISSLSDDIDVLSMGMSADWKEAIEAGSNEVRIGTAIFGERK